MTEHEKNIERASKPGPNRQMRRAAKARVRRALAEPKRSKYVEEKTGEVRTRGGSFGGSKFHTEQAILRRAER